MHSLRGVLSSSSSQSSCSTPTMAAGFIVAGLIMGVNGFCAFSAVIHSLVVKDELREAAIYVF
jgi:hypothetical protein